MALELLEGQEGDERGRDGKRDRERGSMGGRQPSNSCNSALGIPGPAVSRMQYFVRYIMYRPYTSCYTTSGKTMPCCSVNEATSYCTF